ncbi:cytochrome c oxidase accessory protein CcoG [Pseudopedobacter saltans DSM 12145]|uniref:Cytochrome c oxidase accessory protein CcoG n=1 Tax=Pseudopedobacter saltans (strain ATCC 51119 / DSM 12145 / JCM 21818 / CCUG 39354 / LMG 10337 / NBRC 100064 / NCIMB 13643) TaxID=762903 RepID=F0S536_PSESL|nr:cytochrome c oxidase accessory protein CcoG [Pseudopedobacter saltans]ADY50953.1 cytochrome c oxidase accessory protein CcoG [Pseudopedobacter saltans DSM 12145]
MEEIQYHSTVQADGKRRWLYPLVRKDKFYTYRSLLGYSLLAFLFVAPFVKIKGNQLLLINIIERKFIIFGQVIWPQDFFIFVLASLLALISIVLFTIAFGRVFCGWVCPQTIFLELVFRRIEIWIEGEPAARKKLDESPWTAEKIWKKSLKHGLYILISFLIANTFLAYVIGSDELIKIMTSPPQDHLVGFISIWLFTFTFYAVFSHVREIVCTVICPYGRLQGVLLDKNSLTVAYNYVRGEPRGKLKKGIDTETKGDCVDCNLCVAVCPTGIDIRQGTQLECVNCTACIDACNQVMDKINKPRNLIGYYSEEMIKTNKKPEFSFRMKAYSFVILVMVGVIAYFIWNQKNVDVIVLRAGGTLYQEQQDGYISNLYNGEFVNKTTKPVKVDIEGVDKNVKIKWIQPVDSLARESSKKGTFFLLMPKNKINQAKNVIKLRVLENGQETYEIKTNFLGPVSRKIKK